MYGQNHLASGRDLIKLIYQKITKYFSTPHLNLSFSKDTIFESGILRNLSCRVIKGATQHWPPFTYITKNEGMKFKLYTFKHILTYAFGPRWK